MTGHEGELVPVVQLDATVMRRGEVRREHERTLVTHSAEHRPARRDRLLEVVAARKMQVRPEDLHWMVDDVTDEVRALVARGELQHRVTDGVTGSGFDREAR